MHKKVDRLNDTAAAMKSIKQIKIKFAKIAELKLFYREFRVWTSDKIDCSIQKRQEQDRRKRKAMNIALLLPTVEILYKDYDKWSKAEQF